MIKRFAYILFMLSSIPLMYAQDCCFSSCYPCEEEPLVCGAFDVRVHGGFEPIAWHKRGGIFSRIAIDPLKPTDTFDVQGQCIPKYSRFFKTPWVVGAQLGYALSHHMRLFIEGNYLQAQAKCPAKTILPVLASSGAAPGTTLNFTNHHIRLYDGYVGVNYYYDRCGRTSIFIGAKIGFVHHKASYFSLTQNLPLNVFIDESSAAPRLLEDVVTVTRLLIADCPRRAFLIGDTTFAGGGSIGVDICLCPDWSLILSAECIANRGPKTNCYVPLSVDIVAKSLFFGPIKRELRFPILIGVRHIF